MEEGILFIHSFLQYKLHSIYSSPRGAPVWRRRLAFRCSSLFLVFPAVYVVGGVQERGNAVAESVGGWVRALNVQAGRTPLVHDTFHPLLPQPLKLCSSSPSFCNTSSAHHPPPLRSHHFIIASQPQEDLRQQQSQYCIPHVLHLAPQLLPAAVAEPWDGGCHLMITSPCWIRRS